MTITHVLCPVDFSDFSRHALAQAAALARWYGAKLTALHVFVNRPSMDLPALVLEDTDRDRLLADVRTLAEAVHVPPPFVVRVEEAELVHEAIVAEAKAIGADLLVLGSHGRSRFQQLFLGSVAENVLRRAPCSTLVVPRRAVPVAAAGEVRFKHILCLVDFSECSLDGVASALGLSLEADAQLTLLHVVEMPPAIAGTAEDLIVAQFSTAVEEEALKRLEALIPDDARTYCTVETTVVEGRAPREILRQASERDTDLIVMGVRGRGAIDRLVFGSTTHGVLHAARCPVLVVH